MYYISLSMMSSLLEKHGRPVLLYLTLWLCVKYNIIVSACNCILLSPTYLAPLPQFCRDVSKSFFASPSQVPSQCWELQVKSSQVTTYSRVKSQPSASHVKSLVFGFKPSQVTRLLHVMYLYFNVFRWFSEFC